MSNIHVDIYTCDLPSLLCEFCFNPTKVFLKYNSINGTVFICFPCLKEFQDATDKALGQ